MWRYNSFFFEGLDLYIFVIPNLGTFLPEEHRSISISIRSIYSSLVKQYSIIVSTMDKLDIDKPRNKSLKLIEISSQSYWKETKMQMKKNITLFPLKVLTVILQVKILLKSLAEIIW